MPSRWAQLPSGSAAAAPAAPASHAGLCTAACMLSTLGPRTCCMSQSAVQQGGTGHEGTAACSSMLAHADLPLPSPALQLPGWGVEGGDWAEIDRLNEEELAAAEAALAGKQGSGPAWLAVSAPASSAPPTPLQGSQRLPSQCRRSSRRTSPQPRAGSACADAQLAVPGGGRQEQPWGCRRLRQCGVAPGRLSAAAASAVA